MADPDRQDDTPLLDEMPDLPAGAFDVPEPPAEFRETLLGRTAQVVRAHGVRRRARTQGALLVVFLVGGVAGFLVRGSAPEDLRSSLTSPREAGTADRLPRLALPSDPSDLDERLAEVAPEKRRELLRDAGNTYLKPPHGDPRAALYCYRRLLEDMPESRRATPEPQDSWLLVYLKLAH